MTNNNIKEIVSENDNILRKEIKFASDHNY